MVGILTEEDPTTLQMTEVILADISACVSDHDVAFVNVPANCKKQQKTNNWPAEDILFIPRFLI